MNRRGFIRRFLHGAVAAVTAPFAARFAPAAEQLAEGAVDTQKLADAIYNIEPAAYAPLRSNVYSTEGVRESLEDAIYDISPMETPITRRAVSVETFDGDFGAWVDDQPTPWVPGGTT